MTQWNKYGLTAARRHGKPGRDVRPKSTTVDIHSHVAIPQAAAFVKPHLDISTIPLAHFADAQTKALSQKQEEDVRARVVIHPNGFTDARRLKRFYFNNVIGNPLETTIALHYLIFDGVLERHPDLKILAVHGGGYLPAYCGRIDHAWGARSDAHSELPQPPTSYLKKIYFDTVVL